MKEVASLQDPAQSTNNNYEDREHFEPEADLVRYEDVAETSAAESGSRECQTTTDALCLYFVCPRGLQ